MSNGFENKSTFIFWKFFFEITSNYFIFYIIYFNYFTLSLLFNEQIKIKIIEGAAGHIWRSHKNNSIRSKQKKKDEKWKFFLTIKVFLFVKNLVLQSLLTRKINFVNKNLTILLFSFFH